MVRRNITRLLVAVVAACVSVVNPAPAQQNRQGARQGPGGIPLPEGMKPHRTTYYTVYSDLDPEQLRGVFLRLTKMHEEYRARTWQFSGQIQKELPFYLFKNAEDYRAAGGPRDTAGVFAFRGHEAWLMAFAGEGGDVSAHVIQHEGFHQFAHAVIRGAIPPWVNEGLAEYFGESVFTGDGFVTGVIPPDRLKRIKERIKAKQFKTVKDMMLLNQGDWNAALRRENYDQAWSMVHFLAHGDNGAYQGRFTAFMKDISNGRPWQAAWERHFPRAGGFEEAWAAWWLSRPPDPTGDLYARATVATLTSYLGRLAKQKPFDDLDAFRQAANAGQIKLPDEDWLPPGLLQDAIVWIERDKQVQFALETEPEPGDAKPAKAGRPARQAKVVKAPRVVATLPDKTRIVGTYKKAGFVQVEVDDLATVLQKAKELLADQKKAQAQSLLEAALKRAPGSPLATEARKLLQQAKKPTTRQR